jgi:putative sterol carrier protein
VTVEDILSQAPDYVDPAKADGIEQVVDLHVDEERWQFVLRDGLATMVRDGVEEPHVTVRFAAEDLFAVVRGEANPAKLYAAGRLQASGDLWGARVLKDVFRRPPGF